MFLTIVMLIVSLTVILVGANLLVDGSSALARRFGMSDVTVGLTVVAFGTSSPELAISIVSALDGATSLTVGNVVGSNAFNIMMIIGITAMIKPLKVERTIMSQQMPLMVLSALLLLMLGNSSLLDGTDTNIITRTSGMFMLLLFALFMIFTVLTSKVEMPGVPAGTKLESGITPPIPENPQAEKRMPLWKQILWIALGLAGLIWGGDEFVDSVRRPFQRYAVSTVPSAAAYTGVPKIRSSFSARESVVFSMA